MKVLVTGLQGGVTAAVERAAAGDEEAFAAIVSAYERDMVRVAYGICGEADGARDAVQAALLVAWRKLGTVRQPEQVRSWLVAVAANEARQLVRRRHRARLADLTVDPSGPADTDPPGLIGRIDLQNALRRLSPDERTVIALHYGADLDSDEIGHLLGISASGIRSRLSRVIDRLRKELGDA